MTLDAASSLAEVLSLLQPDALHDRKALGLKIQPWNAVNLRYISLEHGQRKPSTHDDLELPSVTSSHCNTMSTAETFSSSGQDVINRSIDVHKEESDTPSHVRDPEAFEDYYEIEQTVRFIEDGNYKRVRVLLSE